MTEKQEQIDTTIMLAAIESNDPHKYLRDLGVKKTLRVKMMKALPPEQRTVYRRKYRAVQRKAANATRDDRRLKRIANAPSKGAKKK